MHGTDRTLRSELGHGGKQTHRDVYDPETGGTRRVPVNVADAGTEGQDRDSYVVDDPETAFLEAVSAGTLAPNVVLHLEIPVPIEAYEELVGLVSAGVGGQAVSGEDGKSYSVLPVVVKMQEQGPLEVAPALVLESSVRWVKETPRPAPPEPGGYL